MFRIDFGLTQTGDGEKKTKHYYVQRPKNERPFVLIPVGLPSSGATVPAIVKKDLAEVLEIK